MLTLKRCAWTALLIFVQPIKLISSVLLVGFSIAYDVGREFVRDLKSIWTEE